MGMSGLRSALLILVIILLFFWLVYECHCITCFSLDRLLRGLTILGAIIVVFGYSYSHLLLHIYGGSTLTDGSGPLLMKTHCFAIWLMAINGVTEAYVFAAMSQEQLNRYNRFMVILSAIFLGLSWLLSRVLGSVGFILANCVNMILRITHRLVSQMFSISFSSV